MLQSRSHVVKIKFSLIEDGTGHLSFGTLLFVYLPIARLSIPQHHHHCGAVKKYKVHEHRPPEQDEIRANTNTVHQIQYIT